MMTTPWDVEGWFVGTVHGEAVNCQVQFRTKGELTEVCVHAAGNASRQSAVSHSPDLASMARHVIQEFQDVRQSAGHSVVAGPAASTSGESRIVSLHDYLGRDQLHQSAVEDTLAGDQVRSQSR
jgi:hypothetical protein